MKKKGWIIFVLTMLLSVGSGLASYGASGWALENGKWVYYDMYGQLVANEWKKGADNQWRYLNSSGDMALDSWVDEFYYVDSNGIMAAGRWFQLTKDLNGVTDQAYWYYFNTDGKAVMDSWKKIDNKWYHFDSVGRMETGWVDDNMYFMGDDGAALTGWHKLTPPEGEEEDQDPFDEDEGKKWYYFNSSGKKYAADTDKGSEYSEKRIDGNYYCFNENGVMQTGWVYLGTGNPASEGVKNFRFYGKDGKAITGWYTAEPPEELNGYENEVDWFYFGKNGVPKTGPEKGKAKSSDFTKINGKSYLFNSLGTPVYGLQKVGISGDKVSYTAYYFEEESRMAVKGKRIIEESDGSKVTYYFQDSGRGFTGVKSGYLYYMGKLQEAEAGSKYQPITIPNMGTYVVNTTGRVIKSSSGVKDENGVKYATDSDGILIKVDGEAVNKSDTWMAPREPLWD